MDIPTCSRWELRNSALSQSLHIILWLIPSGIVLALFSGWWMARKVLNPLEILSATARQMSIAHLHKRLPITGTGDELDRLSGTFNVMFGRLETAVGQMKEFTASISHELRTPLTALRGEAEVALAQARTGAGYREVLESQLEELEKLSRMIDRMLILARAEAGQIQVAQEQVNLSQLSRSLVDQMEIVAASKSITLTAELEGDVFVTGDSGWLEHAILNLVDNAIKFTPEGGHVSVKACDREPEAFLEVRDDGIGISEEALPHIFERFYRGDASRSREQQGAGLGLSLVDWIVKQHHGRIAVESRPHAGTVVRLRFPKAPDRTSIPPA